MPILWRSLLILLLLCPPAAAAARPAAQGPICFPDVPGIGDCLAPEFSAYWQGNGGLAVFGYPIGPREPYAPAGAAAPLSAQWTERNRLESHPQNPPAYQVQLGRMGAEVLAQRGRSPAAELIEDGPQPGCLWFAETRHNLCDQADGQGFLSYWRGNGQRIDGLDGYQRSLALFGLPITAAQPEPAAGGELILTQWFERARFEWRPDNPGRSRVLLGLLGRELYAGPQADAPAPAPTVGSSIFGVEISRGQVAAVASRLFALKPGSVRYNGVLWAEVEPTPGARNWAKLAGVDTDLATISASGAAPLLIVRGAPAWAQQIAGKACGPIRPDALAAFATFMGELVARYSQPPYNVKHWELGNEPDADANLVGGGSPFGCWGDPTQPYHGGAAYAAMLKAAYPAIKAADTQAQVISGGLLLDCDPTLAAPCSRGSFLEGVLRAGGGDAFDLLAYHSYTYWEPKQRDWDIGGSWSGRGGVLLGKLAFLRELLARYSLQKPIIMNEGGLLCYRSDPSCGPGGFYPNQANYVARLYTRSWASGLVGATWFTLNGSGWQEGGLLDSAQQPRPAYQALQFLSGLLAGASYDGSLSAGPVEGYAFRKGDTRYQIYWTNNSTVVDIPIPADTVAIYTMLGARSIPDAALLVGFAPLIVEIRTATNT